MTNKMTNAAYQRACEFVRTEGRRLDAERLEHTLSGGNTTGVLEALAPFQNEDGGFGHGIEPDFRTPASTALATSVGLGVLRSLGIGSDHAMVRGAIAYLVDTVDQQCWVWPIINADVDLAPHAPWWNYSSNLAESWNQFRFNPTAELLGYCHEHSSLVPDDMLGRLSDTMIENLVAAGTLTSFYDIRCCLALYETPGLPQDVKAPLTESLKTSAAALDLNNPHANYLDLIPTPDSLLAEVVADHFAASVDKTIRTQEDNGSWAPWWDWSEVSEAAWRKAEVEWRGSIARVVIKVFAAHDLVGE